MSALHHFVRHLRESAPTIVGVLALGSLVMTFLLFAARAGAEDPSILHGLVIVPAMLGVLSVAVGVLTFAMSALTVAEMRDAESEFAVRSIEEERQVIEEHLRNMQERRERIEE